MKHLPNAFFLLTLIVLSGCASTTPQTRMAENADSTVQKSPESYFTGSLLRYQNAIYEPVIRTLKVVPNGELLGPSILRLNQQDFLTVTFDDLSAEFRSLSYTFIHCDVTWEPSGLNENEYLSGFHQSFINDYQYSFNTNQRYISYRFTFPNQDIQFTKSGNYLLLVFDGSADKPVCSWRFMVAEESIRVNAAVSRPSINAYRFFKHEIDFTVYTSGLQVQNPFAEIIPVILQNHRWDNAVSGLKPIFVKGEELVYDYDEANNFPGGNEYRQFDIRSLRRTSEFVAGFRKDSVIHTFLVPQEPRQGKRYVNIDDINGHYVIRNYDGGDDRVESDYSRVHFNLQTDRPISGGQIYVFGELTNWGYPEEARMIFDPVTGSYTTSLYLKQGYYNYAFMMLPDSAGGGDPVAVEGMHFDTEVPYTVLIYYRSLGARFDRLVGYSFFNSRM